MVSFWQNCWQSVAHSLTYTKDIETVENCYYELRALLYYHCKHLPPRPKVNIKNEVNEVSWKSIQHAVVASKTNGLTINHFYNIYSIPLVLTIFPCVLNNYLISLQSTDLKELYSSCIITFRSKRLCLFFHSNYEHACNPLCNVTYST